MQMQSMKIEILKQEMVKAVRRLETRKRALGDNTPPPLADVMPSLPQPLEEYQRELVGLASRRESPSRWTSKGGGVFEVGGRGFAERAGSAGRRSEAMEEGGGTPRYRVRSPWGPR
jgi:hypothetical protein